MAADILLYQLQWCAMEAMARHVELTRADCTSGFNRTYGPVFTVPEITTPPAGAQVADLSAPTTKMGKSGADGSGVIYLLDPPDVVRRKVSRAVTDSRQVPGRAPGPGREAGVTNLLDILAACGGSDGITTYGALKQAVTEAVVAQLDRSASGTPTWPPTRRTSPRSSPTAPPGAVT